MRYRSRPTECEAVQWPAPGSYRMADSIVTWVNANGGEARYEPESAYSADRDPDPPRIAIRTVNGWAFAAPGHYVVMGEAKFDGFLVNGVIGDRKVRDFYPCDPETFERRWVGLPTTDEPTPVHSPWGQDPSGYCGCADCSAPDDEGNPMTGTELIAAERQRQINAEGWTPEHDAEHDGGELVDAAACYLVPRLAHAYWPWSRDWWKPTPDDRVRELVKAGALIAAEIDRLIGGPGPTDEPTENEQ